MVDGCSYCAKLVAFFRDFLLTPCRSGGGGLSMMVAPLHGSRDVIANETDCFCFCGVLPHDMSIQRFNTPRGPVVVVVFCGPTVSPVNLHTLGPKKIIRCRHKGWCVVAVSDVRGVPCGFCW